ncbi:MAG TPA: APC family permease [Terriglobia bacterium]|nr:APC family permease [Terriglobia bacterium]
MNERNTIAEAPASTPHLRRVLSLGDLIFYGIVIIQPIAAVTLFGIAEQLSGGHVLDTVLVGTVPILLTAVSYGRLAALYPAAGSAYTYTAQAIHPLAGFVAGWAMLLGYICMPLINVIYGAVTLRREFPTLPFWVGALAFALLITGLNLLGIRWTARANELMLAGMCAVIAVFAVLAVAYLFRHQGWSGLFSWRPFYNPATFHLGAMATATSFAALTYIGFDSVTTLAEDVDNPQRNVLVAVVLVVIITALLSGAQVYLGHQVWPDYASYPNPETAFMDIYQRVGGVLLFHAMGALLIVACFGAALSGQVAAARILYGMGRDRVLPGIFARLSLRWNAPAVAIVVIGVLSFVPSGVINFEKTAEILNAGALATFMAVNLAAFWQFYLRGGARRRWLTDAVAPLAGLASCLAIWLSLPRLALSIGILWLAIGLALGAFKARNLSSEALATGLIAD